MNVWIRRSCSLPTILSDTILDTIQNAITSAVVKARRTFFILCPDRKPRQGSPLYVKIWRQLSNKEVHFQSRNRNFIALWQCRSHAFNIPCKNSSKKPQQGFPSLFLLAVAFKLRILPLVHACVMLQLARPCPAMSPADSDPELFPKAYIPGLIFWPPHHCGLVQWYKLLAEHGCHQQTHSDHFPFFLWNCIPAGEVTCSDVWLPAPWPLQSSLPLVLSDSLHLLSRKCKLQ